MFRQMIFTLQINLVIFMPIQCSYCISIWQVNSEPLALEAETNQKYCIQGKFRPNLFSPFSPSVRGRIQTGRIEFYIKIYIKKLEKGRIQEWVNQFQIPVGRK